MSIQIVQGGVRLVAACLLLLAVGVPCWADSGSRWGGRFHSDSARIGGAGDLIFSGEKFTGTVSVDTVKGKRQPAIVRELLVDGEVRGVDVWFSVFDGPRLLGEYRGTRSQASASGYYVLPDGTRGTWSGSWQGEE